MSKLSLKPQEVVLTELLPHIVTAATGIRTEEPWSPALEGIEAAIRQTLDPPTPWRPFAQPSPQPPPEPLLVPS